MLLGSIGLVRNIPTFPFLENANNTPMDSDAEELDFTQKILLKLMVCQKLSQMVGDGRAFSFLSHHRKCGSASGSSVSVKVMGSPIILGLSFFILSFYWPELQGICFFSEFSFVQAIDFNFVGDTYRSEMI